MFRSSAESAAANVATTSTPTLLKLSNLNVNLREGEVGQGKVSTLIKELIHGLLIVHIT